MPFATLLMKVSVFYPHANPHTFIVAKLTNFFTNKLNLINAITDTHTTTIIDGTVEFPRELYEYLDFEYTLLDVEASVFPEGMKIPFTANRLPVGLVEDFLLYSSNKHQLLSCVFSPIGANVGAIFHTATYLVKGALAFSLAAIAESFIKNWGLSVAVTKGLTISFNIFCVTPLAVLVAQFCIMSTSVLRSIDAKHPKFRIKRPLLSFFLLIVSRLSLVLLCGLVLGLLVLASVFSFHTRTITFIRIYLTQILVPSVAIESFIQMLLFYPYKAVGVHVLGNEVFCIGRRYCETLRRRRKKEGSDFTVTKWSLLVTLFSVEFINDLDDNNVTSATSKEYETNQPRAKWVKVTFLEKIMRREQKIKEEEEAALAAKMISNSSVEAPNSLPSSSSTPSSSTPSATASALKASVNTNTNTNTTTNTKRASISIAAPQVNPLIASERRQSISRRRSLEVVPAPLPSPSSSPLSASSFSSPMHATSASSPLALPTDKAMSTEAEDTHTHTRFSLKISKKEEEPQTELKNEEDEAPAHLAAVTEKAMHTNIGSRVALFEHINAGQVDEDEKTRAADEAVKTNRRLSIQIHQSTHENDRVGHPDTEIVHGHLMAVTEKAMHTNIGSRVALFEHINAGQVDEEEKKRAADEAVKTNRRLSIQIHQSTHENDSVGQLESHVAPDHLATVTENAMQTQIGSRVAMYEHLQHNNHVDDEEKKRATEAAMRSL